MLIDDFQTIETFISHASTVAYGDFQFYYRSIETSNNEERHRPSFIFQFYYRSIETNLNFMKLITDVAFQFYYRSIETLCAESATVR